jgi:hypothetical protein
MLYSMRVNKADQLDEIERILPGLKRLTSDRSRLCDTVQCRISILKSAF